MSMNIGHIYIYIYIYTRIASVKSTMLVISELDCQLAAHMHEQWVHFPTRATRSRPAPRMWKSFSRLVYPRQILTVNWSARLAFMEFGQFVQVDKSIRGGTELLLRFSKPGIRFGMQLFNSPFGKTLLCTCI